MKNNTQIVLMYNLNRPLRKKFKLNKIMNPNGKKIKNNWKKILKQMTYYETISFNTNLYSCEIWPSPAGRFGTRLTRSWNRVGLIKVMTGPTRQNSVATR
jgi:hypothetical protein